MLGINLFANDTSFSKTLKKAGKDAHGFFDDIALMSKRDAHEMHAIDDEVARLAHEIGADLPSAAEKSGSAFSKFLSGVGKLPGKLHEVGSAIAGLNSGGQLTTDFEAAAQAASVSSRKIVAMAGLSGKALNQANAEAAGMVMGMGMSAEAAGNASAYFKLYGNELKAWGIDSAQTLAKVEDVGIASAKDVANNVHHLATEFQLSSKDMADLGKEATATGETLHDMSVGFQDIDEISKLARQNTSLMAENFKTLGAKQTIAGIYRAQRGIFTLTGDVKSAREASIKLQSLNTKALGNFRNMFAGASDDLDGFTKGLAVSTGDIEQAFELMQKSPDQFIEKFSEIALKMKKDGRSMKDFFRLFHGQMEETMGEDTVAMLVNMFDKVDDAKVKAFKASKAATRDLGQAAKEAWRSPITLQQSFDMMMGSMESRFRQIGMPATHKFIDDTRAGFEKFNNTASALVSQGGPMGKFVQKLAEMNVMGAKALLPETLRPMVAIFDHLSPSVFQSITAFSSLASAVGPLGLGIGAVAGGFLALRAGLELTKTQLAAQTPAWKTNQKALEGYQKQLGNMKKGSKDFNNVSAKIASLQKAQKTIADSFTEQAHAQYQAEMKQKAMDFVEGFKEVAKTLPDLIKDTWKDIEPAVTFLLGAIWGAIKKWVDSQVNQGGHFLGIDWEFLGKDLVTKLFTNIGQTVIAYGDMWKNTWARHVITPLQLGFQEIATAWDEHVTQPLKNFFKWISDTVDSMFGHSTVVDMFEAGFTRVEGFVNKLSGTFHTVLDEWLPKVNSVLTPISSIIDKVFGDSGNKSIPERIADGIVDAFTRAHKESKESSIKFVGDELKLFTDFTHAIYMLFNKMWTAILKDTQDSTQAAAATIQGSLKDMENLKAALSQVLAARAEVENAVRNGEAPHEIKHDPNKKIEEELLQMTAWPKWYTEDYKGTFQTGVQSIVQAVKGSGMTAAPSNGAIPAQLERLQKRAQEQAPLSPQSLTSVVPSKI